MARSAVAVVGDIAADQWGLLTTAQARHHGVSGTELNRMANQGVIHRIAHGVYATPAAESDDLVDLRAAWLSLDPATPAYERLDDPSTGVVSHTSAAALHQLGDLTHDVHHFTLPRRYQSRRDDLRTYRDDLTSADITIVKGLPTTTVPRTISDLTAAGHDMEHIGQIVHDALWDGKTTPTVLREHLVQRHGPQDGTRLTNQLLHAGRLDPAQVAEEVADIPAVRELASLIALQILNATPAEHLTALSKQIHDALNPRVDWSALSVSLPKIDPPALPLLLQQLNTKGLLPQSDAWTKNLVAPLKFSNLWQELQPLLKEADVPVPSPDDARDES